MIRIFKSKKLLFTPTEFLNSVARWLLGVHSPTGTIRIKNTANPAEDGGPAVDLDGHETYKLLDPFLRANYPKVRETALLGASMKWNGGQLDVDENWVRNKVFDYEVEAGETASTATAGELAKSATRDDIAASSFQADSWASGIHTDASGSVTNTQSGTDYVKKGVKVQMLTRVAIAAGEVMFFFRTFEFTENGILKSVSAEDSTRGYAVATY